MGGWKGGWLDGWVRVGARWLDIRLVSSRSYGDLAQGIGHLSYGWRQLSNHCYFLILGSYLRVTSKAPLFKRVLNFTTFVTACNLFGNLSLKIKPSSRLLRPPTGMGRAFVRYTGLGLCCINYGRFTPGQTEEGEIPPTVIFNMFMKSHNKNCLGPR